MSMHAITILGIILIQSEIVLQFYTGMAIFWALVILSFTSFLNVAWRNPGYVTYKETVTEQNLSYNNSYGQELEMKNRNGISPGKMPSALRLDSITVVDCSTHVQSSPDAKSPKFTAKFDEVSPVETPKFGQENPKYGQEIYYEEEDRTDHPQEGEEIEQGKITDWRDPPSDNSDNDESMEMPPGIEILDDSYADEDEVDEQPSSIIVTEVRFWTVCNVEQPIRAKHCKDCGKCVALHDHHWPWIGTCVGEKNRFFFYWYLVFQWLELWVANVLIYENFEVHGLLPSIIYWGLAALVCPLVGFFTLMVTALLIFHTYLAMQNQTTWESVSWKRISYLKSWPKEYGSPFSSGICGNLWYYCTSWRVSGNLDWTIPEKLPE